MIPFCFSYEFYTRIKSTRIQYKTERETCQSRKIWEEIWYNRRVKQTIEKEGLKLGTEKYEVKQESIASAAFGLFREKGFDKTSVKDIADAAGIKKALVRYYFPKKEALEDLFLTRNLDLADGYISELDVENLDTMQRIYLLGYFELYYVCNHKTMLKVGKDIMRSREMTRDIQQTIVSWIFRNNEVPEKERQQLSDAILYALGAAFEFIYFHMIDEIPFDLHDVFNVSVTILKTLTKYPLEVPDVEQLMPDEWMEQKCREMDRAMFGIWQQVC